MVYILFQLFSNVLTGTKSEMPRETVCTEEVISSFSSAVNALYIRNHFDEKVVPLISELLNDITAVFSSLISQTAWMDAQTKAYALNKVRKCDDVSRK